MIHSLTSLSPVAIIVVSLLGLGFGWHSPYLSGGKWMRAMKVSPESIRSGSVRAPMMTGGAFLLTVASTFTLVAAREGANALFEHRAFRHLLIVSGHDVVPCVFQGAVPGAWH